MVYTYIYIYNYVWQVVCVRSAINQVSVSVKLNNYNCILIICGLNVCILQYVVPVYTVDSRLSDPAYPTARFIRPPNSTDYIMYSNKCPSYSATHDAAGPLVVLKYIRSASTSYTR